jgi:hypothetical protein
MKKLKYISIILIIFLIFATVPRVKAESNNAPIDDELTVIAVIGVVALLYLIWYVAVVPTIIEDEDELEEHFADFGSSGSEICKKIMNPNLFYEIKKITDERDIKMEWLPLVCSRILINSNDFLTLTLVSEHSDVKFRQYALQALMGGTKNDQQYYYGLTKTQKMAFIRLRFDYVSAFENDENYMIRRMVQNYYKQNSWALKGLLKYKIGP